MPRNDATASREIQPRRAFTLIELLVVVSIIIVMLSVAVPAVKSLMRSNSQKQSINMIRAYLSTARSVAISHHCQAGVVFFEESAKYAPSININGTITAPHVGQTALQLIVEDPSQYTPTGIAAYYTSGGGPFGGATPPDSSYTGFIYYSRERLFLPVGVQAAALNDNTSVQVTSGDSQTGNKCRVILFDANGQLLLRNGISRQIPANAANSSGSITYDAGYPQAYVDWNLTTMLSGNGNDSYGVSSPGVLVFSMSDYTAYINSDTNSGPQLDQDKANWIQQHSDVLIVNAYTGNIIQ